MRLINFIVWISAGFVIGWVLNQMSKDSGRKDELIPVKVSTTA